MLVRKIYITWREKIGSRRYVIAKLKRNTTDGITFNYCEAGFNEAKKKGLDYFLGFKDSRKLDNKQIKQLLSLRVISEDRHDRNKLLSFWNAENITDTFDLLALTQGKSPTDNFEFLAEYFPKKNLSFVTDLAGISHLHIIKDTVKIGDKLTFKFERDNPHDKHAVALYKGKLKVGYIKKIHNMVFHMLKSKKPTLVVKAIDQNGTIKQVFISVDFY